MTHYHVSVDSENYISYFTQINNIEIIAPNDAKLTLYESNQTFGYSIVGDERNDFNFLDYYFKSKNNKFDFIDKEGEMHSVKIHHSGIINESELISLFNTLIYSDEIEPTIEEYSSTIGNIKTHLEYDYYLLK